MQKLLFVLVLLGVYGSSFGGGGGNALRSWRWRNNDGNETTATWKAAQNTSVVYNNLGDVIRLRLGFQVYGHQMSSSLQYTTTPGVECTWTTIGATNEKNDFVMAGASSFVTQGEIITRQITNEGGGIFIPGKMMLSESLVEILYPGTQSNLWPSEIEWVFKGTGNVLPGTTYYFRQTGISIDPAVGSPPPPSLTTSNNVLTYMFTGSGNYSDPANWRNNILPPTVLLEGQIYVNPGYPYQCILDKLQYVRAPAKFQQAPFITFTILNNFLVKE